MTAVVATVILCGAPACTSPPNAARGKSDLRSRVELANHLLEIADDAASVTNDTVSRALIRRDSPLHVAVLERNRSDVTASVRSMALSPNPEEGIVRLYVWSRIAKWTCENRVAAAPDMVVDICEEVYGLLASRIDSVAEEVLDANTRAHLDTVVANYKLAHPGLVTIGLMRIDDISSPTDTAVLQDAQPTMMSPVTDAARQLEHTRLLGNQLVWLISRMPGAMSEQAESTTRILLESDRVQQAFAQVKEISGHASATAQGLESVAKAQTALAERLGALDDAVEQTPAVIERLLRHALIGLALIALGTVLASLAGAWAMIRHAQRKAQRDPQ